MKNFSFIPLLIFVAASCTQQQSQSPQNTFAPKVVEAHGYIVPKDSMAAPKIILVDEKKIKKIPVGKPKIVPTNTNIHIAITTNTHIAGTPRVCTPGKDTFALPKTVPAIDSPFVAGIPEVTLAKDPHINDNNPQSFSSFSKLQGLKHDVIRCILQDKNGNLWFGTDGGASKYDGKFFTHFTEKEGLSNNSVLSILQDKSGNLWFGTDGGGVSKYDGNSFTHFAEIEGLSNNKVWSILQDKNGNIWFGTNGGGVSKYDGNFFTRFSEKEGLSNNKVSSIFQDKSGNLWFGTNGGGVSKYDGNSFTHFTEKEGLSNNNVLSILQDKSGDLWFGTSGGVNKFDGKSFTHFTEKEGLSNNTVWSILQDKSGNLWFGTYGGVCKYDPSAKLRTGSESFTHFTEKEGLSNNTVWSILQDKSGNIWFATDGGVCKYNGKSFTHFTEKEGLSNNTIRSILQDKSGGSMWFGTEGGGVAKYDGSTFTHFTKKEGLSNNTVLSIFQDKNGNLWFGTYGGGVSKYDGKSFIHFSEKEGLNNNQVWSILQDKSGNIWFCTYGGVSKYDGNSFTQYTEKEGLNNNRVNSILEDKNGNLWFGTDGGICKYDPSAKLRTGSESFTHFTEKEGLSNSTVWSILQDKSGNIWFGTYGEGVSKYDGKSFTRFTEKEGLSSNTVLSICQDKNGNLWFGTRFGLSSLSFKVKCTKIQEEEILFKNYTYDDGFYGIGCNGGNSGKNICQDKNGIIWIAANDRLTAFHPEGDETDTVPPNIQLTSIALFNENIAWVNLEQDQTGFKNLSGLKQAKDTSFTLGNGVSVGNFQFDSITKWYSLPENLSLAYTNNYLTFNFIGITQKSPKKVKYQFKLEGIDESWSAVTNRTEAPYGNLPNGTYTFKVKAMNSDGYWSNEFNYNFTIRPPLWKTWWFRTLVGALIFSCMVFYIKWRERALKGRLKRREEREITLEQTIVERTAEVVEQKHLIEVKHKEITDSLNYAERIQKSFLATTELLDENLKEYFVFFQPKDVVSGDFYWAAKLSNSNFALVTADSTGHGVPGAIMSILNISCLEKSVEEENLIEPGDILNHSRKKIIERLKKDGSPEGGKDGMDCSLISFDFANNKLTYAAANNPIWIVRRNSPLLWRGAGGEAILLEFAPDKMPVGKHDKDAIPFTQHTIDLENGDIVYTLTDGFPDQFGGPKGKKFMSKNLKELLTSIAHLPMQEQKEKIKTALNNWKGDLEQVDDVCLIGVRIK